MDKNIYPILFVLLKGFPPLSSIIFIFVVIADLIFSLISNVSLPDVSLITINILFSNNDVNWPNNKCGFSVKS